MSLRELEELQVLEAQNAASNAAIAGVSSTLVDIKGLAVPVLTTLQAAATGVGNGTPMNVYGKETACLMLTGTTTSATVVFETTVDTDVNTVSWVAVPAVKQDIGFSVATSSTINAAPLEIWEIGVKARAQLRARISTIGNGNLTVVGLGVV